MLGGVVGGVEGADGVAVGHLVLVAAATGPAAAGADRALTVCQQVGRRVLVKRGKIAAGRHVQV